MYVTLVKDFKIEIRFPPLPLHHEDRHSLRLQMHRFQGTSHG